MQKIEYASYWELSMQDFIQNEPKRAQGEKKAYVIEALQKKKSYLSGALT